MNHTTSTTIRPTPGRSSRSSGPTGTNARPVRPLPRSLIYRSDPAAIAADHAELWAMTVQERINAMWAGRLTGTQLTAWSARHPEQVPSLGGELAHLVMHTDEFLEDPKPKTTPQTAATDNVIKLPVWKEAPRAAA